MTIEALGVRDAALSIIGHMGQSLGFVLFSSLEDFEAFLEATDAIELGEAAAMPQHFALNFEPEVQLSPALRNEVLQHRWEVAGSDAYPWVFALGEDVIARSPTAKEVTVTEVVALALTKLLEEKAALLAACNGYEVLERRKADRGLREIQFATVCVPYVRTTRRRPPRAQVKGARTHSRSRSNHRDSTPQTIQHSVTLQKAPPTAALANGTQR